MDDFLRAVEATLFASASPLSPEEIGVHAGAGDVAAALELARQGRLELAQDAPFDDLRLRRKA